MLLRACIYFLSGTILILTLSGCRNDHESTPDPPFQIIFHVNINPSLPMDAIGELDGDTVSVITVGGADLSLLTPEFNASGVRVAVNNLTQKSGVSKNDFTVVVPYTVTQADSSKKIFFVKFVDTGFPVLQISTSDVPIVSKEVYVDGNYVLTDHLAGQVKFQGKMTIKGRGNSSWNMPKKPYHLKLDKKASLAGMPASKNWLLLANYADKTLMRNELGFELSRRAGMTYTPRSTYVELMLNDQYEGNYELTEKIDVGADKVNIEEQPDGSTSLPAIAGGYILEVDSRAETEPGYIKTTRSMLLTIDYPDDDDITTAQQEYISHQVQLFEDALFADNFTDPALGYRRYFDVDSYVTYYIINEVMANPDIFWSTYMYKKRNDEVIYTGPVWDFDLSANIFSVTGNDVNLLMLNASHPRKTWIRRLMQDPMFRTKIKNRWNELRDDITTLPEMIDLLSIRLHRSQKLNFMKWNILSSIAFHETYIGGSYPAETDHLKAYLTSRIKWLDATFNGSDYK